MHKGWRSFALLMIALCILVAWSSLHLNQCELAWQLQKQEFVEGKLSHMYLVARFVDQRKLYLNQIDRGRFDQNESERFQLLLRAKKMDWEPLAKDHWVERIRMKFGNALRILIGKPRLADPKEIQAVAYMEQAFRLEQAREYSMALAVYARVAPLIKDPALRAEVLLHQGYNNALHGQVSPARDSLQAVIARYPQRSQAVIAALLLQHLDQVEIEQKVLANSSFPAMVKAQKASLLFQCAPLLDTLYPNLSSSDLTRAQMLFVRGLCQEDAGKKELALQNYLEAIPLLSITPPTSITPVALVPPVTPVTPVLTGADSLLMDINRRILIMGTQIKNGERICKISQALHKIIPDSSYDQIRNQSQSSELFDLGRSSVQIAPEVLGRLENMAQAIFARYEEQQRLQESIASAPPPKVERVESLFPKLNTFVKVLLKDGKSFSGEVVSVESEPILRLKTMIGVIGVPQAEIKEMQAQ